MPPATPPKPDATPPAPALPGGPDGGCGPFEPPPPPEPEPAGRAAGVLAPSPRGAGRITPMPAVGGDTLPEPSAGGGANGRRPAAAPRTRIGSAPPSRLVGVTAAAGVCGSPARGAVTVEDGPGAASVGGALAMLP